MAKNWILAPPGKGEKNAEKMGKLAQKRSKMAIFPFFSHFLPFFSGGVRIQLLAIFLQWCQNPISCRFSPNSGLRPNLGSVQGNRDCKTNCQIRTPKPRLQNLPHHHLLSILLRKCGLLNFRVLGSCSISLLEPAERPNLVNSGVLRGGVPELAVLNINNFWGVHQVRPPSLSLGAPGAPEML